jgi:DNA-binding response OmpR family regulator
MRVLLVEDNPTLSELLVDGLGRRGFSCDAVLTREDAKAILSSTTFDAVVLDLSLPDGDGLTLLRDCRNRGLKTPILILSARDAIGDRIAGLDSGADDYVVKPADVEELAARLRALLRRPGTPLSSRLCIGNLTLDTVNREVCINGIPRRLGSRETSVLEILMRRAGRVVPKPAIEESIYSYDMEASTNAVEAQVSRLRKHLAEGGSTAVIHTLHGIGYMLAEAEAENK